MLTTIQFRDFCHPACCPGMSCHSSLMMEAARTSETSVDNYFTRQYIPEDNSELHTRRREDSKSHVYSCVCTAVPLIIHNRRQFITDKPTEREGCERHTISNEARSFSAVGVVPDKHGEQVMPQVALWWYSEAAGQVKSWWWVASLGGTRAIVCAALSWSPLQGVQQGDSSCPPNKL
jgi:hypothetical protein